MTVERTLSSEPMVCCRVGGSRTDGRMVQLRRCVGLGGSEAGDESWLSVVMR